MGLFGFGAKKKDTAPACACQSGCPTAEVNTADLARELAGSAAEGLSIKVLGTGCVSCHTLLENTQAAVNNMGLALEVEYVTDMAKIAGYGVMSVPALVINNKVASMGKVLKTAEVEALLNDIKG